MAAEGGHHKNGSSFKGNGNTAACSGTPPAHTGCEADHHQRCCHNHVYNARRACEPLSDLHLHLLAPSLVQTPNILSCLAAHTAGWCQPLPGTRHWGLAPTRKQCSSFFLQGGS